MRSTYSSRFEAPSNVKEIREWDHNLFISINISWLIRFLQIFSQ